MLLRSGPGAEVVGEIWIFVVLNAGLSRAQQAIAFALVYVDFVEEPWKASLDRI